MRTGLVGGKRVGPTFMERIEMRAKQLRKASEPPKQRKLKPGEENQLMLPGLERRR